jgi:hypothetical protein
MRGRGHGEQETADIHCHWNLPTNYDNAKQSVGVANQEIGPKPESLKWSIFEVGDQLITIDVIRV